MSDSVSSTALGGVTSALPRNHSAVTVSTPLLPFCICVCILRITLDMALAGLMRRLNNNEYKNWMKAGQCLCMLQDRLLKFIVSETQKFHREMVGSVSAPARQRNNRCKCRAKWKQFQPNCPVCAEWKEIILSHHKNRDGDIHWGNCHPSLWPTHYWEVAKVYLPRGHLDKAPNECDAAAFLNLLNTCDHFKVSDISRVREMIKCRNDLMHNSAMKVSSSWLADFGHKMHEFVSEFKHIPGLAQEGQTMQEVLMSDWNVEDIGLYEVDGQYASCEIGEEVTQLAKYMGTLRFPADIVEINLIRQLLQELYLQIEEHSTLSNEDQDNFRKVKDFLAENYDLQCIFEEDIQKLEHLQKDNDKLSTQG
ncbi:uncharacterized protein CXorf38 homolog [Pseudophryne corroboree]|uniref:uncharacterized protein CXorf38 homolog n=1 Tax=Pseudophryne corroboree TaxID=495146 RepID=UPI003081F475